MLPCLVNCFNDSETLRGDGMWFYKVKQPPGSPPVYKARYLARGFCQREGVDFFKTFALTPKMTTLWVLLHWHDTLRSTLRDLGFRPSSDDPSLFVRAGSTPFFMLVYVNNLVFAAEDRAAVAQCRSNHHTDSVTHGAAGPSDMGLVLGGTRIVELTGHYDSSYADDVETQRSTQGYCFCLGAGAVSWRSTQSSSVASSSAEADIYAGAMAAQELCLLTFLLTNLGERPRSAPTLYAKNKAMILLCREPQLESRVKHIDEIYFLLRELQRRSQARLEFVASKANTADVFTKALALGDNNRFCVQLRLVEVGPRLL
ncbi:unnamed protein product [Closterium sp. NIES-53]